MAEKKKFYWIKLKSEFFDLETIDWLMAQENGCEYVVLYQKLCLLTANRNGEMLTKVGDMLIPYDAAKIVRDTKFSFDTVVVALELFKKIGLIYEQKDGVLKIPYVSEMIGEETSSAKRVREYRSKKKALEDGKKALQCNENVTQDVTPNVTPNVTQEIRDKRLEIRDKNIEIRDKSIEGVTDKPSKPEKRKFGEYRNVLLSDEEYEKLKSEFPDDYQDRIERLSEYIESKGAKYKSHIATIRSWARRDFEQSKKAPSQGSGNIFLDMLAERQGGDAVDI